MTREDDLRLRQWARCLPPSRGSVYLASNPAMPGLFKLGMVGAGRRPTERLAELSSATGLPEPFALVAARLCDHPDLGEQMAHALLAQWRVSRRREFFRCPAPVAVTGLVCGVWVVAGRMAAARAIAAVNDTARHVQEAGS